MTTNDRNEIDIDRSKAVLAGLLYACEGSILRTNLAKLTFMLDEANYRLRGETVTEYEYEWDHFGPNAKGNAIVHTLDEMVDAGFVNMHTFRTAKGYTAYNYWIPNCDPSLLPLSSDDWIAIHAIVHNYGTMTREQITTASKATLPVKKAQQYEALEFSQEQPLTQEEINSSPLWRETFAAIDSDTGNRISIEEMRSLRDQQA